MSLQGKMAQRAVVFAYHDVGVRGLATLLAHGVDVALVVSHEDDPHENIWFASVAELAALNHIPVITPADPNVDEVVRQLRSCRPDWLFSFYYRHMLAAEVLNVAAKGAYNLHGSLLPKYRGRVPVNWAVLHGEETTGASLHRMVEKPDAGHLIDQQAVPILPNDTAYEVFKKVVCAAETVLHRSLPAILSGKAQERPLDLTQGSYFSGRRPEDGRIDWSQPAWALHNLIRAVAPPYPGAFTEVGSKRLQFMRSYWRNEPARGKGVRLYWENGRCYLDAVDGRRLQITQLELNGKRLDEKAFAEEFAGTEIGFA